MIFVFLKVFHFATTLQSDQSISYFQIKDFHSM